MGMVGHLSENDFKGMAHYNIITKFPFTVKYVTKDYKIFAPDLAGVKGKHCTRICKRLIWIACQSQKNFIDCINSYCW